MPLYPVREVMPGGAAALGLFGGKPRSATRSKTKNAWARDCLIGLATQRHIKSSHHVNTLLLPVFPPTFSLNPSFLLPLPLTRSLPHTSFAPLSTASNTDIAVAWFWLGVAGGWGAGIAMGPALLRRLVR